MRLDERSGFVEEGMAHVSLLEAQTSSIVRRRKENKTKLVEIRHY